MSPEPVIKDFDVFKNITFHIFPVQYSLVNINSVFKVLKTNSAQALSQQSPLGLILERNL
jgi:hypothetical protein